MLPVLQIGPLALPVPQFSLLVALWIGLSYAENQAKQLKFPPEALYNLVFTGLTAGLLGARIAYIMQYPAAFIESPLSLVSLNAGLLDLTSGAGIGLIAMLIYGQRQKLSFMGTLDALTPLLAVMGVGFAVSHIASGAAFGSETSLPWGINLWGTNRHPSQFYELAAAAVILVLTALRLKSTARTGMLFLGFAAQSAGARLFLEAFRGDSSTLPGGFREAQVAAWVIMAAMLVILDIIRNKS